MSERRSLKAGLKPADPPVDPAVEKMFVYGSPSEPGNAGTRANSAAAPEERESKPVSRSPLTTRIRTDYAVALKRASLERQLQGVEPNTILDILEEALGPWLKTHGYIS